MSNPSSSGGLGTIHRRTSSGGQLNSCDASGVGASGDDNPHGDGLWQRAWTSIVSPIYRVFTQGLSAKALTLSLAFGVTGGLWPIPGTTSLVCGLFIYLFGLNIAACQLANLCVTPLEFLMVVPFIRMGEAMFFVEDPLALSPSQVAELFASIGIMGAISQLGVSLMRAVVAWMLFVLLATPTLYIMMKPIIASILACVMKQTQGNP